MLNPMLLTVYKIDYSRLSVAQIDWSIDYLERRIVNLLSLGCSPKVTKKGVAGFQKTIAQLKQLK
jgi:hypothetical protein